MTKLYSAYPAGGAGVALLALRISVTCSLAKNIPASSDQYGWASLPLCVPAFAIVLGGFTRISALIALAASLALAKSLTPFVAQFLDLLALALLGPGAFSTDSLFFGRVTIKLPR